MRAPDRKAEIARLEIALLEMLERARRIVVGVAGQMHLAVLADDPAVAVGQDRGVEALAVRGELGIAERDGDLVFRRPFEQRPRRRVGHLALEPGIDLRLVGHVPAREERGERKLGVDDEVAVLRLGLVEQIDHPPDHGLPAVGLLDRAALGGRHAQDAAQGFLPLAWTVCHAMRPSMTRSAAAASTIGMAVMCFAGPDLALRIVLSFDQRACNDRKGSHHVPDPPHHHRRSGFAGAPPRLRRRRHGRPGRCGWSRRRRRQAPPTSSAARSPTRCRASSASRSWSRIGPAAAASSAPTRSRSRRPTATPGSPPRWPRRRSTPR